MLKKIDHIGIAVENIDTVNTLFKDIFGLEALEEEIVENQKVRVLSFKIGNAQIELLEATDPSSPIAKFIEKRGQGMHHITFEVEDIKSALLECQKKGIQLIDEKPRIGAEGKQIAFLHPKSTAGVLIELSQAGGE